MECVRHLCTARAGRSALPGGWILCWPNWDPLFLEGERSEMNNARMTELCLFHLCSVSLLFADCLLIPCRPCAGGSPRCRGARSPRRGFPLAMPGRPGLLRTMPGDIAVRAEELLGLVGCCGESRRGAVLV